MADTTTYDPAGDILVVDDDLLTLAVIVEFLTEAGYALRQASNGAVA